MPNYKLGKIYKLVSNNTKDIYIGSTCYKHLSKRLGNHRYDRKLYLEGKRKYDLSVKRSIICFCLEKSPVQGKSLKHTIKFV